MDLIVIAIWWVLHSDKTNAIVSRVAGRSNASERTSDNIFTGNGEGHFVWEKDDDAEGM